MNSIQVVIIQQDGTLAIQPIQARAGETVAAVLARWDSEVAIAHLPIGVFGMKVAPSYVLQPGDRLEVYRPIWCDPKAVRRQRSMKESRKG